MMIPFGLLLLAIAVMPFVSKRWWEKFYPHLSLSLGAITVVYYIAFLGNPDRMFHSGMEYLSFIILIGSLFVVSGGIHIRIKGKSTPVTNVILLAIGAIVSNIIGTTGASMILIRPYLRVNKYRLRGFHIVFFIFIVSNIGGALTPIGDPPLFLGYLRGVPFFWLVGNAWHIWLLAIGLLLAVFYGFDYFGLKKYEKRPNAEAEFHEEAEVSGLHNGIFLAMILLAVLIQHPPLLREAIMLLAAAGSYITTKKEIHRKNEFSFLPIKEVAILFLGIFATMVPALDWLEAHSASIGISSVGQFYWGSGILSSVLDNAPTYLNFLSASVGLFVDQNIIQQVQHLISTHGSDLAAVAGAHAAEIRNTFAMLMKYHSDLVALGNVPTDVINISYLIGNYPVYLKAISIAAVMFGAATYIGNGPNFMVKSIAEQSGVEMPTFAGYVGKYTLPVLLPIVAIIWFFFFR